MTGRRPLALLRTVPIGEDAPADLASDVSPVSIGTWDSLIAALTIELAAAEFRVREIEATIQECRANRVAGQPSLIADGEARRVTGVTNRSARRRRVWVD